MKCLGGRATVDTGFCIASISGQGMGAEAAWDGKIEIEDYIERVPVGGGLQMKGISDAVAFKIDELMQRAYSDVVTGRFALGAFAMPVDVSGSNT